VGFSSRSYLAMPKYTQIVGVLMSFAGLSSLHDPRDVGNL
jgi:hypothetical protein